MPPPLQSCCERAGYSCSGRIFDWIVIIQVQGSVPQSPACSCFVFRRSLPPTYIMMLSFVLRLRLKTSITWTRLSSQTIARATPAQQTDDAAVAGSCRLNRP
ncbi:unnamed protein product [Effrenium voratum]|nr:unnamed protein product [Effrenium voratum]